MMRVHILFFSVLQEVTKKEKMEKTVQDGITIAALLELLYTDFKELAKWDKQILVAVNCEYAERAQRLQDGDEVAIMPPVQGG